MILTWKNAKRLVIGVVGTTVLLVGVAAIFLPILQAWLIIPLGLAILATEFVWAQRLLKRVRERTKCVLPGFLREKEAGGTPPAPAMPAEATGAQALSSGAPPAGPSEQNAEMRIALQCAELIEPPATVADASSPDEWHEVDPPAGGQAAGVDPCIQDPVHHPPTGRADKT